MKNIYISIFLLTVCFHNISAQKSVFNPFMVNLKIKQTLDENKRNTDLLVNQESNTLIEKDNESKTKKLKEEYTKIQKRLSVLSVAVDAYVVSQEANRIVNNIITNQKYVLQEVSKKPYLAVLEINDAIEFYNKTELIIRYLAGVVLSGGAIAQMDNADRKIITNFIIAELRDIEISSNRMRMLIRNFKTDLKLKEAAFNNWINKDKRIVEDIIRNAKNL